jgi:MFS family permease
MLSDPVHRLTQRFGEYPRTFWILFWGSLVNSSGSSMVWPFLTIYLREKLDLPLTTVTLLLTVNSMASLVTTFIAGPITDRFGRKWVMLISMFANSLTYLGMIMATTLQSWVVLMILIGAFNPIYRVGGDSMVADLVEPQRRPNAYALLRMITNLGIAIGPAVGGFLATVSYTYVFAIASAASMTFALIILLLVRETKPALDLASSSSKDRTSAGYSAVLRDYGFLMFCAIYALAGMAYVMFMVLLPVFAKENFGVIESQYGFIMATNAAMVVIFQYPVTSLVSRYPRLLVIAVGSLFYAIGVGSVALGAGFIGFLISMIILTIGELIVMPTSTALTADLAPADMRGRYMSLYGLTFGIGIGIGPVLGGLLNDHISPQAIWYGGFVLALLASAAFMLLSRSPLRQRLAEKAVSG